MPFPGASLVSIIKNFQGLALPELRADGTTYPIRLRLGSFGGLSKEFQEIRSFEKLIQVMANLLLDDNDSFVIAQKSYKDRHPLSSDEEAMTQAQRNLSLLQSARIQCLQVAQFLMYTEVPAFFSPKTLALFEFFRKECMKQHKPTFSDIWTTNFRGVEEVLNPKYAHLAGHFEAIIVDWAKMTTVIQKEFYDQAQPDLDQYNLNQHNQNQPRQNQNQQDQKQQREHKTQQEKQSSATSSASPSTSSNASPSVTSSTFKTSSKDKHIQFSWAWGRFTIIYRALEASIANLPDKPNSNSYREPQNLVWQAGIQKNRSSTNHSTDPSKDLSKDTSTKSNQNSSSSNVPSQKHNQTSPSAGDNHDARVNRNVKNTRFSPRPQSSGFLRSAL